MFTSVRPRHLLAAATLTMLVMFSHAALGSDTKIQILARVGPWPVISGLVGYNGRIWFANSVKGRNHNSADIWSLDPSRNDLRYERYLYSQDAATPLVQKGLLYWPFEDSRFSLGWGMIEVTDGTQWQPLIIPTAQIFHTQNLIAWNDGLLAVTSAWQTGLQWSGDLGRSWTRIYRHSGSTSSLSRLHDPVELDGKLYAYLKDPQGTRLVRIENRTLRTVPGWPRNRFFFGLTRHRNALYAAVAGANGPEIWKTDGVTSTRLTKPQVNWRVQNITSDGDQLWAVVREGKAGRLWSSPDGTSWTPRDRLDGGIPWTLQVISGDIYAAGAGDDGRGIVWGPKGHSVPNPGPGAARSLPGWSPLVGGPTDWQRLGANLDRDLADFSSYEIHGTGKLRDLVYDAVKRGAPAGFFAERMKIIFPDGTVNLFGSRIAVKAADIGRTILLWGMGLARQANVPIEILARKWTAPANSFEKYFDPQLAALWAVAGSGQKDKATIDTLIARLTVDGDPRWLQSQVIGTLSAVTGQRYGYDVKRWQAWWSSAKPAWGA